MTVNRLLPVLLVTSALTLAACDGDGSTVPPPAGAVNATSAPAGTAATAAASTGTAVATCPSSAAYGGELPEVSGVGNGVSLWALLFVAGEIPAGSEAKIVFRMTGTGDLSIRATGPHGAAVTPIWGPEAHTGSTWDRPGDEWGTGWRFPTAGCWTVRASRDAWASATLSLRIAEPTSPR